jgi:nucleoside-diphosphate-sugar epimerase
MAKVLIIGTSSFIGTNFRKVSKNQIIREVSLKDTQPEEIDFSDVEVVLHLAAIVHQSKKIENSEYLFVNRDLCTRTAKQAKACGVKQFILLSTVKVYGQYIPGSEPWNEDSVCYPEDSYGMSKFEAELALRKLEDSDFIVSTVRTPIVYGPGVTANILKLIKLIERFPLLPFKQVSNSRYYTNIENLVGFIDRIIEIKASGTFIAMDDMPLSTTLLVRHLSNYMHKKVLLFKLPDLLVKIGITLKPEIFGRLYGSFYLDNTKTKKVLNYKPPFTTEEGLAKMISSYLALKKHRIV